MSCESRRKQWVLIPCKPFLAFILQDLGVKTVPAKGGGWLDLPRILDDQRFLQGSASGPLPPEVDLSDCQVLPSEQAQIFLCMAQAVVIAHR